MLTPQEFERFNKLFDDVLSPFFKENNEGIETFLSSNKEFQEEIEFQLQEIEISKNFDDMIKSLNKIPKNHTNYFSNEDNKHIQIFTSSNQTVRERIEISTKLNDMIRSLSKFPQNHIVEKSFNYTSEEHFEVNSKKESESNSNSDKNKGLNKQKSYYSNFILGNDDFSLTTYLQPQSA